MKFHFAALLSSAFFLGLSAAAAAPPGPRDWLRHMVTECLDQKAAGYCDRCLRPVDNACGPASCSESLAVWSLTKDYAAIRDRKMCDCPSSFVHGLALPRKPVTGVEDPKRPDGLWSFAWKTARAHISDESEILLAVNGPTRRSQDQLHVHMVRLSDGARRALADTNPEIVEDLKHVWDAAARHAKRQGLKGWYGVAVARGEKGRGFLVAASAEGHPETEFGLPLCRPAAEGR